jgi:hypothetical protein
MSYDIFSSTQYALFLFGKRKSQNHLGPIFGHKTFLIWYNNNEVYNVGMMQSSLNLQTQQNINISKLKVQHFNSKKHIYKFPA